MGSPARWGRFEWVVAGQVAVLACAVAALVAAYPYPLEHPDPRQFRAVGLRMVRQGELLVTWDPPLRYLLLFDLYAVARPSVAVADRLAVLQAGVYAYALVPLGAYGLFASVGSRASGLAAATTLVFARAAGVPPSGIGVAHWQVDVAYPFAFVALALAAATLDATPPRAAWLAALTAVACGLALNAEPWVALFATAGITAAWASRGAWRALALAAVVGSVTALPLLFVPDLGAHTTIYYVEVLNAHRLAGLSPAAVAVALLQPGSVGTIAAGATTAWLYRRGALPGDRVAGAAIGVGLAVWLAFRLTTLDGMGVRGLLWSLHLAIPAAVIGTADALPDDHLWSRAFEDLFVDPQPAAWAVLLPLELVAVLVSIGLFVVTYAPRG